MPARPSNASPPLIQADAPALVSAPALPCAGLLRFADFMFHPYGSVLTGARPWAIDPYGTVCAIDGRPHDPARGKDHAIPAACVRRDLRDPRDDSSDLYVAG